MLTPVFCPLSLPPTQNMNRCSLFFGLWKCKDSWSNIYGVNSIVSDKSQKIIQKCKDFFWLPGLISILSFNRHVSYSQLTLLIYSESLSEVSSDKIYYIWIRVFSTEIIFQRVGSKFLGDYYCELWLLECIRDSIKHSACLILTSSLFSWFSSYFLISKLRGRLFLFLWIILQLRSSRSHQLFSDLFSSRCQLSHI